MSRSFYIGWSWEKNLIISSSPRKGGNSDILCDLFITGAQQAGQGVRKISLKDKKIGYCTGCGVCTAREKGCTQQDDIQKTEAWQQAFEMGMMI